MNALDLLKRHEGYRRHPYQCTAGKNTVGYGRNLDDVGIDEHEAEYLLDRDITKAVAHLRHEHYWLDLDETRQAVLIDMVVNIGWAGFEKFRFMRAALEAGDYVAAAAQMKDSRWAQQVPMRAAELIELMRAGWK